jgi:uncharacterized protein YbcC (UPF0753/DUF2309 family)
MLTGFNAIHARFDSLQNNLATLAIVTAKVDVFVELVCNSLNGWALIVRRLSNGKLRCFDMNLAEFIMQRFRQIC